MDMTTRIVVIMLVMMGLVGTIVPGYLYQQSKQTHHWPHVDGVVVRPFYQKDCSNRSRLCTKPYHWNVWVEYVYQVRGISYHHDDENQLTGAVPDYSTEKMQELLDYYYPGRHVAVYYDPENPDHAVLVPTTLTMLLSFMAVFGTLLAITLALTCRYWWHTHTGKPSPLDQSRTF